MLPGSPQTKSFILLFGIALSGCVLSLLISDTLLNEQSRNHSYTITTYSPPPAQAKNDALPIPVVDTSSWKTYRDANFKFSFLYSPVWSVKQDSNDSTKDYTVYIVDPGKRFDNFKLYISKVGYYAMEGLPTIQTTIDGKPAVNSDSILYGIQNGATYYTLDIGASLSLTPEFNAWVKSFKFE